MKSDQVPKTPVCLHEFILDLEDGGKFTIPQMQKFSKERQGYKNGFSWHTCNNFIMRFDPRFRPKRISRSFGPGKPFIYQIPMSGPAEVRTKKYRMKRVSSPVDIDHPEKYTESEEYKNQMKNGILDSDSRKVKILKILFPNGVEPKEYSNFLEAIEFLSRMNDVIWDAE